MQAEGDLHNTGCSGSADYTLFPLFVQPELAVPVTSPPLAVGAAGETGRPVRSGAPSRSDFSHAGREPQARVRYTADARRGAPGTLAADDLERTPS